MHPPLFKSHPLCKAEVDTLVKCHDENPYVKFFGVCNEAKSLMDLCFREEKNLRKKLNKKVPTNLPSVFMNPSSGSTGSGGGGDSKSVE
jgi:COX assembly protein 2